MSIYGVRKRALLLMILCLTVVCGCGWLRPAPKPEPLSAAGIMVDGVDTGGLTRSELREKLNTLAAQRNTNAINAGFHSDTGILVPERLGRELDVNQTVEAVMSAPLNGVVEPVYRAAVPGITTEKLANAEVIGAYVSQIVDKAPGRVHNIRLTAALINNTVVENGNEFSFNRQTGEPTVERGFQNATIFTEGRHEQGIGGGMCQVSSTLYNAVLAAKLPVTERHSHSQPVNYVPPDRDATTFTDKDFRFVNNRRQSIMIRAFVEQEQLRVDLHLFKIK